MNNIFYHLSCILCSKHLSTSRSSTKSSCVDKTCLVNNTNVQRRQTATSVHIKQIITHSHTLLNMSVGRSSSHSQIPVHRYVLQYILYTECGTHSPPARLTQAPLQRYNTIKIQNASLTSENEKR